MLGPMVYAAVYAPESLDLSKRQVMPGLFLFQQRVQRNPRAP